MTLLRMLSSIALLWLTLASTTSAHEIVPSILNLRAADGQIQIEIVTNAEAIIANVDLSAVSNTNDAANGAEYDRLRALPPQVVANRFGAFFPTFLENLTMRADGQPVVLRANGIIVTDSPGEETPREATLYINGTYPVDAKDFEIGWIAQYGKLIVRQNDVGPSPFTAVIADGALTQPFPIAGGSTQDNWKAVVDYIPLGFDEIVPKGLAHILFALGLFFLASGMKPLVWQLVLFAVAHLTMLALATLGGHRWLEDFSVTNFGVGFITIANPLIALTVVLVAVQNFFLERVSALRATLVFASGLLHGLVFASALAEIGPSENAELPALIGFSIGLEIGFLAVISVMFLIVWQALRVDEGVNEASQGIGIYGVLLIIFLLLCLINPASLVITLESPVWVFAAPLAGVFALCALSIQFRDQVDSYRKFVAMPCSAAIALVGVYWCAEWALPFF